MPRIRTIKPDFFKSETIHSLDSDTARLLFIGLWTYVDDHGKGRDDPRLIRAELFPFREDWPSSSVETILEDLAEAALIQRYVVHGKRFLCITNWTEHQRVSKPTDSRYPNYEDADETINDQELLKGPGNPTEVPESPGESLGTPRRNKEREVEKEQGSGKGSVEPPAEVLHLCNLLADLIEMNGSKRPSVTKAWWQSIDRMVRLDNRTEQEIEAAIRWSQQDNFWHRNILSPDKLRSQFDRLRLDARAQNQEKAGSPSLSTIDRLLSEVGS